MSNYIYSLFASHIFHTTAYSLWLILGLTSILHNSINARSAGDQNKAVELYEFTTAYVIVFMVIIGTMIGLYNYFGTDTFGFDFYAIFATALIAALLIAYPILIATRTRYSAIPFSDKVYMKLFSRLFGPDKAVIVGRSTGLIFPVAVIFEKLLTVYVPLVK